VVNFRLEKDGTKWDGLRGKLGSATGETKEVTSENKTNYRDKAAANLKSTIDAEKPTAEPSTLGKSAIDSEPSKEDDAASNAEGVLNVRKKWDRLKGANGFIKETRRNPTELIESRFAEIGNAKVAVSRLMVRGNGLPTGRHRMKQAMLIRKPAVLALKEQSSREEEQKIRM
jgi:hypothetical protein